MGAAGELVRGVPAGGEHAVALREGIGRRAAHVRVGAGGGHLPGLSDRLEEQLAQERSPAVAAHALGRGALVSFEEVGDQPAALLFGGEPFVFGFSSVLPPVGKTFGGRERPRIVFHQARRCRVRGYGSAGFWMKRFVHVVLHEPHWNIDEEL
jgi:hypothetical protein